MAKQIPDDKPLPKSDPSARYLDVDPDMSLEELEDRIRGRNDEVAGVFDSDGGLVFAPKIGETHHVTFSPQEVGMIEPGATITHSHPVEYVVSVVDLQAAGQLDLREIRAVGPRKTFSATRAKKGWPTDRKTEQAYNVATETADLEVQINEANAK